MISRSLKYKLGALFFFVSLMSSCKKSVPELRTEFGGDSLIFVGTWVWKYSEHSYNWCNPPSSYEVITPNSISYDFRFEIGESAHMSIKRNDSLIGLYTLKLVQYFSFSYDYLNDARKFGFILNGHENLQFNGVINSDTIISTIIPCFMYQAEPGCESYSNYFIKE